MLSQPDNELQLLLDREKEFRLKNKQITSKVTKAFKNAEKVMKDGAEILTKPVKVAVERVSIPTPKVKLVKEVLLNPGPKSLVDKGETKQKSEVAIDDALGTEATLRLLKAKVHVLQQEMDVLIKERSEKDTTLAVLQEKYKILEVEKGRDQRQITSLQAQNDKLASQLENLNSKYQASQAELQSLRREAESLNRNSKQSEQDTHARDLRLNRSLEELERLKSLMANREAEFKDKLEAGKRTAEGLFTENKRLQMQKNELINGFKKQGQLIEILKRQKMHIEAAKLVEISEEQFMRSLK